MKLNIQICLVILALAVSSHQEIISKTNGCTLDHCHFCQTDGKVNWCTRCGNGKVISALDGKDRFCKDDIKVPNCRAAPLEDQLNVNACGECQRGYFLESPTKCVKLELAGCDRPFKKKATGPVLCEGCLNKFVKDDQTGCEEKPTQELAENCKYGGKQSSGKCLVCHEGWFPSVTFMSCEEEKQKGCKLYHPNEPQRCLTCNGEEGYYAVRGVLIGTDVYQYCKLTSFLIALNLLGLTVFTNLIL